MCAGALYIICFPIISIMTKWLFFCFFLGLFQGFLHTHTQLLFEEDDKLLLLRTVNGYKYIEKVDYIFCVVQFFAV